MGLYKHQLDIIRDDKPRAGIFIGTGGGKTLIALSLARGKTLVIAPKTQVLDKNWEREVVKNDMTVDLTVISKETFRRDHISLPRYDTVIVDEAHTCLGVMPNIRHRNKQAIPKASQLFEALESFVERTQPSRFYLCTATVIRSPMTVWAAAKLLGYKLDFYKFRHMFYVRLPMPGREVWVPKTDSLSKDRLAKIVRMIGYTGRLEDFFDVPEQTYKTIYTHLNEKQKKRLEDIKFEYPDPLVRVGKIHQVENGVLAGDEFSQPEFYDNEKLDVLRDIGVEFPRLIVFCKYRNQLEQIRKMFERDGKRVFLLDGDTKDRGRIIKEANQASEYVFLCQAQISAGWELPDCPVMVFASMTYSIIDRIQAEGRILRANNLKKNLYITLVVKGGVDEAVLKAIEQKKDFDERIYIKDMVE